MAIDCSKVECVAQWPVPKLVKKLRGLLRLSEYHRRFVKNYGTLAKPLVDLLKKNEWGRNDQVGEAFKHLKQAICNAPVLSLPEFRILY